MANSTIQTRVKPWTRVAFIEATTPTEITIPDTTVEILLVYENSSHRALASTVLPYDLAKNGQPHVCHYIENDTYIQYSSNKWKSWGSGTACSGVFIR